jgi:hypothetical protein
VLVRDNAPEVRLVREWLNDSVITRKFCMKVLLTLMVAAALGGCSYQPPSGAFTPEAECARNGGRWRPGVGAYAFCERGGGGGA